MSENGMSAPLKGQWSMGHAAAGGATSIIAISRPLSRSFCAIVVRIAAIEECLLLLVSMQPTRSPLFEQEILDRALYMCPKRLRIWLEYRPLSALVN